MVLILTWLLVYTLILLGLNRVVTPLRARSWFKILFLPGTALAAVIQAGAAKLCVASSCRVSLFRDGEPAFDFEAKKLPPLAGALFMVVTHALLYVLFLIAALKLESRGLLPAFAVSLPSLGPEKLAGGRIDFDFSDYLEGLDLLLAGASLHPLTAGVFLYAAAGAFASLRCARRESRWMVLTLAVVGAMAFIANHFGAGFPFLSRGWWAGFSYFPRCWALFSLYVTLAWLALVLFLFPGAIHRLVEVIRSWRRGGDGGGGGRQPAKAPRREKAPSPA